MLTDSVCVCATERECVRMPVCVPASLFDDVSVRITISLSQCSSEGSLNVTRLEEIKTDLLYLEPLSLTDKFAANIPLRN